MKYLEPGLRSVHGTHGFLSHMLSGYPGRTMCFIRMAFSMVNLLVKQIKNKLKPIREHKACISVEDKITAVVRFLATGIQLRQLQFSTRISEPSLSNFIPQVCLDIIEVLGPKYIRFPKTADDWRQVAREFYQKWNMPNYMGAIDGRNTKIQNPNNPPPPTAGTKFFNHKLYYIMVQLSILDVNYCFF